MISKLVLIEFWNDVIFNFDHALVSHTGWFNLWQSLFDIRKTEMLADWQKATVLFWTHMSYKLQHLVKIVLCSVPHSCDLLLVWNYSKSTCNQTESRNANLIDWLGQKHKFSVSSWKLNWSFGHILWHGCCYNNKIKLKSVFSYVFCI